MSTFLLPPLLFQFHLSALQVRGLLFGTITLPVLSAAPYIILQVKYYDQELICYCTVSTQHNKVTSWIENCNQ